MSEIPEGWDYNPSTWQQRIPIVGLAVVGLVIATYLSLFQLGVSSSLWEPLFPGGSHEFPTAYLAHLLPVPDAAIVAAVYLMDAVTGIIGGRTRWRTMPWAVIVFGVAVGPLGAVSVLMVIFQPLLFNAWCSLCLASLLVSVLMIGPAMDEVLASLQVVKGANERGESAWKVFWKGGDA